MRILFIHDNFPGQYRRIANRLARDRDYELLSGSLSTNQQPAPIRRVEYTLHRKPHETTHRALKYTEQAVITGQAALAAFAPLARSGWKPDIILGHSGWGSAVFLKDLWPDTKYLAYLEWYYNAVGGDVGFLRSSAPDLNDRMRLRMKNTPILHDLAAMDWGQCPTRFQASQFPSIFMDRVSILHDGVDTTFFSPSDEAALEIDGKVFKKGDPLITYIARGMEPHRGFPQFIEAVARLQKMNKDVHTLVIGADRVAYGPTRRDGKSFKQAALEENELDLSRLHFVGRKPLNYLRDALRVSAAHVYLTVPFVLSWSMMEAMSAGALVVASNTAPVAEVIRDGESGLLFDFHDPPRLADRLADILSAPGKWEPIRAGARRAIVERYDVKALETRYLRLIRAVANGKAPDISGPG